MIVLIRGVHARWFNSTRAGRGRGRRRCEERDTEGEVGSTTPLVATQPSGSRLAPGAKAGAGPSVTEHRLKWITYVRRRLPCRRELQEL